MPHNGFHVRTQYMGSPFWVKLLRGGPEVWVLMDVANRDYCNHPLLEGYSTDSAALSTDTVSAEKRKEALLAMYVCMYI